MPVNAAAEILPVAGLSGFLLHGDIYQRGLSLTRN